MKIYADTERTKELRGIYFGIVKSGESKTIIVYLFNETSAILSNLKFRLVASTAEVDQVKILSPPKVIRPHTLEPLKLRWSPSKSFKAALEVQIEIDGDEIYLAPKVFRVERKKDGN